MNKVGIVNDPIADILTRIRNALMANYEQVDIPASKLKVDIASLLLDEGYIAGYEVEDQRVGKVIRIKLKYVDRRRSVINGLKRVSKPGSRNYVKSADIPRVRGGMGTTMISTSEGVMTGHEARKRGIGGELMAYVW